MSATALVQRPQPLPGLRSWTIETVVSMYFYGCSFSPDTLQLAYGGADGNVRIWNFGSEGSERILVGHGRSVVSTDWSPDGRYLVSVADDNTLRYWESATGRLLRTITVSSRPHFVAWSPVGELVASVHQAPNRVCLWDAAGGQELRAVNDLASAPESLRWSPDGKLLAGTVGEKVMVWVASNAQSALALNADVGDRPRDPIFSPDGRWLAASGNRFYLWEMPDGKEFARPELPGNATIGWTADSKQLAICLTGINRVQFWDLNSGKLMRSEARPGYGEAAFSRDCRLVASFEYNGANVCDIENARIWRLRGAAGVTMAQWSPDDKRVAFTNEREFSKSGIWDPYSNRFVAFSLKTSGASDIAWSPQGQMVAVTNDESPYVHLFDPDSGDKLNSLDGLTDHVNCIAWSPDGRFLATAGGDRDVRIWDVAERKAIYKLAGHTKVVWALAWSPDGTTLASGGADLGIRLWNPADGTLRRVVGKVATGKLAWSPDSKTLASTNGMTTFWDPADGTIRKTSVSPQLLRAGPWAIEDKTLVTGANQSLGFWDTATGKMQREIKTFRPVRQYAISPDRNTLLATGRNGLQVLDIPSGQARGILINLNEGPFEISADGHWRGAPGIEKQVLYVAVTESGEQETLTYEEFSQKYGWKNDPEQVRLLGE